MKVSILYSSKTGNTRKLAYSIANELSDFEITITDIKTMESLPQADAYLIGYWVDKAQPNEEAKHCIEQITGKPVGLYGVCLFVTWLPIYAKCQRHVRGRVHINRQLFMSRSRRP